MKTRVFDLSLVAMALSVIGAGAVAPQRPAAVQAPGRSNPACALLSVDEIRKITGFPGYTEPDPGDPPGQGLGGGASCQYQGPLAFAAGKEVPLKGPLLSIVLINGKNFTQSAAIGKGCRKEVVPGVGDMAFFEVCPPTKLSRTSPLYVKAGSADLVLQMDIETPDTDASLRSKLVALAQAAVAKAK